MLKTKENREDSSCLEIQYTGLQKGEKIHEELFIGENVTSTEHPMIMKAHEDFCSWSETEELLVKLELNQNQGNRKIRQLLLSFTIGGADNSAGSYEA